MNSNDTRFVTTSWVIAVLLTICAFFLVSTVRRVDANASEIKTQAVKQAVVETTVQEMNKKLDVLLRRTEPSP